MMTSMEDHEAFEELCGGPTRAFLLHGLYEMATQAVSGDRFRIAMAGRERSPESAFRRIAVREGFSSEEIEAYLNL